MTLPYRLNPLVRGLTCLRCATAYSPEDPAADLGLGCPACLGEGFPASLRVDLMLDQGWAAQKPAAGMARYGARLPYIDFPTLGEGATPLMPLALLARRAGVEAVWLKSEGQNPTGSHKDRMSALVVARAASVGRDTVVAASSGNAGASLAAYAAAAGLRCVVVSTAGISPIWAQAIRLSGADLVLTKTPLGRWQYMQQQVERDGWYPVTNYLSPPAGSNPFGVQGYKTVAYEIVEQCGPTPPTRVVVPTARGDLLWGIYQGLWEMQQAGLLQAMPRLVAVEPIPRLSRVLSGEDYRQQFEGDPSGMTSIDGPTATYQSLVALRGSRGCAVEVSTVESERAQRALAGLGFYVELSSAASLAALQRLSDDGRLDGAERVVLVATSNGYKEMPLPLDLEKTVTDGSARIG